MDDINFDELDEAVNSVLKQPERPSAQDESPVETAVSEVVAETSGEAEPKPVAVAPIVPKRRGQFMDMVHPSSDMTTTNFSAQRPSLPSRQTGTLQPLDPAIVEAVHQPVSEIPSEESVEEETPEEIPAATQIVSEVEEAQQSEWPDPLDSLDEVEGDAQNPPEVDHEISGKVAHVEAGFVNDGEEGDEEAGPSSPFIDGTEVEKRPLGAFTEEAKAEEADTEAVAVAEIPAPLPEELAPEVVSVESDESTVSQEAEPELQGMNQEGMSASISQQYRAAEEPLDNEQPEGHPVFDTKEYHQPLAPPAKRSKASRVGRTLLAIFFIIVFGVAAGYVIWAFKLL